MILNAGIMAVPAGTTEQGYEIQFGTNHLGHALLTKLLLPTLLKTAKLPETDVRIVSLASIGHVVAPFKGILFDQLRSPMDSTYTSTMVRYGQSKLANILFVKELSRRYTEMGITAVAVHPGLVRTDLYEATIQWPVVGRLVGLATNVFWTNVRDGATGQLWAASAPRGEGSGMVRSGEYYAPVGVTGQGSWLSDDMELARRLWDWTEKELESYTF
jgi:retinol dehydrogenase-12